MAELMFKIANDEAPDIRVIRPDLPEALSNVVARAMAKRPETRYQTGDEFARDLKEMNLGSSAQVDAPLPYAGVAPTPASEKTVAFASTLPNMSARSPIAPHGTDLEI
jgi:serine/threonine-protein kinase